MPIRGDKGASVHVRELVRALATIGHDVRIFAANAAGNNVVDAPVREIPLDRVGTVAAAVLRTASPSRHPRLLRESFEIGHALSMYRAIVKPDGAWRPAAIYERYSLFSYGGVLAARRLGIPHALEVNAILRRERLRSTGVALPRTAAWLESWLTRQTDVVLPSRHHSRSTSKNGAGTAFTCLKTASISRDFLHETKNPIGSPGRNLGSTQTRRSSDLRVHSSLGTESIFW